VREPAKLTLLSGGARTGQIMVLTPVAVGLSLRRGAPVSGATDDRRPGDSAACPQKHEQGLAFALETGIPLKVRHRRLDNPSTTQRRQSLLPCKDELFTKKSLRAELASRRSLRHEREHSRLPPCQRAAKITLYSLSRRAGTHKSEVRRSPRRGYRCGTAPPLPASLRAR